MDPLFLDAYDRELRHLAEVGAEFAAEFPKVAARLGLEGFIKEFQCPDPYVERLLEGFAFMAARVRLKLEAEYPRFSGHLLDMVYPDYLAPLPSMGIVQFQPDISQGSLAEGTAIIGRSATLKSLLGRDVQTACEYRTAHPVTLWPITLAEGSYQSSAGAVAALGLPGTENAKAALRLRLRSITGVPFTQFPLDRLDLYLRGDDAVAMQLYEQLLANVCGVVVTPGQTPAPWSETLPRGAVTSLGFADEEALFPPGPRTFQGYRLLREYFAFAERFQFVSLGGLAGPVRRCQGSALDVIVLFDRSLPVLEEAVDASRFQLFCAPVINLFPRRADRVQLSEQTNEYHIVVDRSRPLDYEVHSVTQVEGFGMRSDPEQLFLPFYACNDADRDRFHEAYYTLHREPRVLSSRQRRLGARSSYVGGEVWLGLVDAGAAPFRSQLRQLGVSVLCTNRDLPLQMPVGAGDTDLMLEVGAPVQAVRFLAGPTEPWPSAANRDVAWKLISHLSLNYLSLLDDQDGRGAAALRELLDLYVPRKPGDSNAVQSNRIESVLSATARPIHRRLPVPGPPSIGRGLEITLTVDETGFAGSGPFLLGQVLEQFFARYVSINAFTETVLRSASRGEIKRWLARPGRRPLS